jgi:hypothetical protein
MKRKLRGLEAPLILVAILFDFVLDPAVNVLTFGFGGWIVDVIATLTFKIWLEKHGVLLFGKLNRVASIAVTALEATPEVSWLPWWTVRIIILIARDVATNGRV